MGYGVTLDCPVHGLTPLLSGIGYALSQTTAQAPRLDESIVQGFRRNLAPLSASSPASSRL